MKLLYLESTFFEGGALGCLGAVFGEVDQAWVPFPRCLGLRGWMLFGFFQAI